MVAERVFVLKNSLAKFAYKRISRGVLRFNVVPNAVSSAADEVANETFPMLCDRTVL